MTCAVRWYCIADWLASWLAAFCCFCGCQPALAYQRLLPPPLQNCVCVSVCVTAIIKRPHRPRAVTDSFLFSPSPQTITGRCLSLSATPHHTPNITTKHHKNHQRPLSSNCASRLCAHLVSTQLKINHPQLKS